jgi:hypothetical protein
MDRIMEGTKQFYKHQYRNYEYCNITTIQWQ